MNNLVNKLTRRPQLLFLLDATGAFITAFLLFAMLMNFRAYIGFPERVLTYLAAIAVVFGIYSGLCFLLLKNNWANFIRAIGLGNLMYCMLTLLLLIIYKRTITILGFTYFLSEIFIVGILILIECKVARKL